jgi:hypothetical protein
MSSKSPNEILKDFSMLDVIEVFDVIRVDPDTGAAIWTGLTGTRAALERDGFSVDEKSPILCPRDWLNDSGYLDVELAREHPRPWSI